MEQNIGTEERRPKVFVSFLGTNNYVEVRYNFKGKKFQTRFIQEALLRELTAENTWSEQDKIVVFCTEGEMGSRTRNWIGDNGLERTLNKLKTECNLPTPIISPSIPEGFNETQVDEMFDTVYDSISPNAEIYFDITHAFRSIPMFATALLDYAHFMKGTYVAGIYYGAFEKLGPVKSVIEMPMDERNAPVIDMTSIIRLQECTQLAANLEKFGRAEGMQQHYNTSNAIQILDNFAKEVQAWDNDISINNKENLKKGAFKQALTAARGKLEKSKVANPFRELFQKLDGMTAAFQAGENPLNIEASIQWAAKYHMLPQAYTMGQEYLIDLAIEKMANINPYKGTQGRQFASALLSIPTNDRKDKKYNYLLAGYGYLVDYWYNLPKTYELHKAFKKIGQHRNEIDHAKGKKTYNTLQEAFERDFSECLNILHEMAVIPHIPSPSHPIFINLSNHRPNTWGEKQLEMAKSFGELVDIPFPEIDDTKDHTYIQKEIDNYFQQIVKLSSGDILGTTIHIMGEMNFTYGLVNKLRSCGYRCVASTTKRIVEDLPNGEKHVKFEFTQFREYR